MHRRRLYAIGEPFGDACTREEGGRRILGGGGGSSSSSSTVTETKNTDKRQVVDNQSVGVSSDSSTVNVTMTDRDAIDKAINLVAGAGETAIDAYKSLLAATMVMAGKVPTTETGTVATNLSTDTQATDETKQQAIRIGALLVIGLVALKAVK